MDKIQQQCISSKQTDESENQEIKALLDDPVLGNRQKLQIYDKKIKIKKDDTPVDDKEHGTSLLNNYDFMQAGLKFVPDKYKIEAVEMIKNLMQKKIISMDSTSNVTLLETNDFCPLQYFLSAVYKLKADVDRYELFLINISRHLIYIRNPKYIDMIKRSGDTSILDTSQQGAGKIKVKRKVLSWIEI